MTGEELIDGEKEAPPPTLQELIDEWVAAADRYAEAAREVARITRDVSGPAFERRQVEWDRCKALRQQVDQRMRVIS